MKKKKTFTISILCDKEITTDVIQLFKFKDNINFKKIKTELYGTEFSIEMEKENE